MGIISTSKLTDSHLYILPWQCCNCNIIPVSVTIIEIGKIEQHLITTKHTKHETCVTNTLYETWILIFAVVNFDALAQASDFRIERRQVVFLCWIQDSKLKVSVTNSPAYRMPTHKPTEMSRIKLKTWTQQPTWLHCRMAFAPGSGDIRVCCYWFRCTGKRFSNRKETSCLPLLNAGFEAGSE